MTENKSILLKAIANVGSASEVARQLGINRSAVSQWRRVPVDRLAQLSKLSGIPKEKLRPDLKALFK
jgi:DNA-binding transcriptional regulator YdaS (Cro superfamily)|tara:strand:- start:827 stop:1027 length:201 start_codon:yes stop_codon:yes gene_type:complete